MLVLEIAVRRDGHYLMGGDTIVELMEAFFTWKKELKIKPRRIKYAGIYDFDTEEDICYLTESKSQKDVVFINPIVYN